MLIPSRCDLSRCGLLGSSMVVGGGACVCWRSICSTLERCVAIQKKDGLWLNFASIHVLSESLTRGHQNLDFSMGNLLTICFPY